MHHLDEICLQVATSNSTGSDKKCLSLSFLFLLQNIIGNNINRFTNYLLTFSLPVIFIVHNGVGPLAFGVKLALIV